MSRPYIKIERIVDEHSPALVQAFLDGTVIPEMKIAVATADGRTTSSEGFVSFRTLTPVSYSLTTGGKDDGMEEFTFVAKSISGGGESETGLADITDVVRVRVH